MLNKAVFLDRDGVINQSIVKNGKPYAPRSFDEFKLLPNVKKALKLLHKENYLLIIVTNQPDVGDQIQKKEVVDSFHRFLLNNLPIDDIEVCFDRNSLNYKPNIGMLLKSKEKLNIDFAKSFMIGDRWRDIDAGKNAGCKTIFIDHGYQESLNEQPDCTVSSLYEAALHILKNY